MMYDWWGSDSWGGWITVVLGVAFLTAAIIGVVFLALGISRGHADGDQRSAPPIASRAGDATDIVRRRYAAGEIEREEYLQKLRDLGG